MAFRHFNTQQSPFDNRQSTPLQPTFDVSVKQTEGSEQRRFVLDKSGFGSFSA